MTNSYSLHSLLWWYINSFLPSAVIWWHRSGSALVQVMAWCLMAPSYYLNQHWLLISDLSCDIHLRVISHEVPKLLFCILSLKIMLLKLLPHLMSQCVTNLCTIASDNVYLLLGANPSPKLVPTYYQLNSQKSTVLKFEIEYKCFHFRKYNWKCCCALWEAILVLTWMQVSLLKIIFISVVLSY